MNDMGVTQATKENTAPGRGHCLTAVDRREMTVKGVSEVISFDENAVVLKTGLGVLTVHGQGLQLKNLSE